MRRFALVGDNAAGRALGEAATRRLALLDSRGELTSEHVQLTARALGVSERTVWRWVSRARSQARRAKRDRFRIDEQLRVRLAYWRGNAAALHRELVAEHAGGEGPVPSLVTVQRAVRRDLTPGERAGLPLELLPGPQGGQEGFLHRLFRLVRLPESGQGSGTARPRRPGPTRPGRAGGGGWRGPPSEGGAS